MQTPMMVALDKENKLPKTYPLAANMQMPAAIRKILKTAVPDTCAKRSFFPKGDVSKNLFFIYYLVFNEQ